jgi:hypothetical protein
MKELAGHDVHSLWIVVSLVGIAAVIALIAVYRRAAARCELEQAERVIAEDEA